MRRIGMAFGILMMFTCVAPAFAGSSGPLDGQWFIVQRAYTPSDSNNSFASMVMNLGYNITIANKQVTAQDSGDTFTVPIAFDNNNPQNLTIGWPSYFALSGIYLLDDNILTVALSFDGSRPTGFDDTTNYLVIVLTKVTP